MSLDSPTTPSPTLDQLRAWGLDAAWSRRVALPGAGGVTLDWHVLDTGAGLRGTIVCVHGNPSWAYLWRDVLTTLSPEWRVIAVDQTNMGYSERTSPRRLAERVDELVAFCRQEVEGPLVLVAHDWGGPVATGAAARLDVRALVLANTAVAKPDTVRVPLLIAVARRMTDLVCRRTPAFVWAAARMTGREHRAALLAPYRGSARRAAIAGFVDDIPLTATHPSAQPLAASAEALVDLTCPILLLWGGRDLVFNDRFLADLRRRVPAAQVQRFARAGHYVPLDEPLGPVVGRWLEQIGEVGASPGSHETTTTSVLFALDEHRDDDAPVYVGPEGALSWRELESRSGVAARALAGAGLAPGERVSLMEAPGPDLLVAAIGCWRAGAVPVVVDASGGLRRFRRLVRACAPRFVIGTPRALLASTLFGITPGATRASFSTFPRSLDLRRAAPSPEVGNVSAREGDVAVIVHTSGSTGPAKPVRYTHGALVAQRRALRTLGLEPGSAFTTSFAPFMLLAPALGMTCVRPDFAVDQPSELGFDELAGALKRLAASAAWLSPVAARRIVASARGRRVHLDLVMLAGAPVAPGLAAQVREVTGADVRTPYGMTECLPVTDGTDVDVPGARGGFSTGRPLEGCLVRVVDIDDESRDLTGTGEWGELLVSAPWMFDGYDADWSMNRDTRRWIDGVRFHRTGDVGYLEEGRLFHLGRLAHVIRTAAGPLASVAVEGVVANGLGRSIAAVGVGPRGAAVLCVVVEGSGRLRLAERALSDRVREFAGHRVAAVLEGPLPVDHRHQSKIDRGVLGTDVARVLAGR